MRKRRELGTGKYADEDGCRVPAAAVLEAVRKTTVSPSAATGPRQSR